MEKSAKIILGNNNT